MTKRLKSSDDPRLTWDVWAEPEGESIEGNALASGDAEADRECEKSIREQLEAGNEWAWACVHVRCSFTDDDGFEVSGEDTLGCCSYASKADFMAPDGYYPQMREAAFDAMIQDLRNAARLGDVSKRLLPA